MRFAAVCVVDPRVPGGDERLAIWAARGCRGLRLRPRLPGEERIFGDPASDPLWAAAERLGIVVSLLAGPQHLQTIGRLAGRFAGTSIVVDHLAHPDPTEGAAGVGFRRLLALAAHPRVFVKLSGFHHFSREPFPFADCWPLVQAVYEHFGPGRLIWGSDFPHVARGGGYGENLRLVEKAIAHWPAAAREAAMGSNAARSIGPTNPAAPRGRFDERRRLDYHLRRGVKSRPWGFAPAMPTRKRMALSADFRNEPDAQARGFGPLSLACASRSFGESRAELLADCSHLPSEESRPVENARFFRQKLASGKIALGTCISMVDPIVVESLTRVLDFVWIDTEHNPLSLEHVQGHLMATKGTETTPLVRVRVNDPAAIKPVLDMGAAGVIVPLIKTADDVRLAVAACKYPPEGIRGFGPRRPSQFGAWAVPSSARPPTSRSSRSCRSNRPRPWRTSTRSWPCRA